MDLNRYNPAVDKRFLILIAGVVWACSGIMLVSLAIRWLFSPGVKDQLAYISGGFIASMPIHHFGFLKIADRNLERLLPFHDKRCIFSFMSWKSWLIIPVMASAGIILRHSGLPKQYLSIIYEGIGFALFLSGIRYFRFFFLLTVKKRQPVSDN